MNKENNATEANAPAIAPKEETKVEVSTQIDYEARAQALEAEKAKLEQEKAHYQEAYLKADAKLKNKRPAPQLSDDEEDEDSRIRRIANETLANSRLADITRELDSIARQAIKENKELKTALMNKQSGIPTAIGTHTEGKPVPDTLVTPEQAAFFKQKGWTDKEIANYKRNLQRQIR